MEFDDALARRRMHREFSAHDVADDVIDRIVLAGFRGPSAGYTQGFECVVLRGSHKRTFFDLTQPERYGHPGLVHATAVVLPIVDEQMYIDRYNEPDKVSAEMATRADWEVPFWWFDAGAAVMAILLAAAAENVGALLYTLGTSERRVLEAFGVPAIKRCSGPVLLGTIGSTERSGSPTRRPKRPDSLRIHEGGW